MVATNSFSNRYNKEVKDPRSFDVAAPYAGIAHKLAQAHVANLQLVKQSTDLKNDIEFVLQRAVDNSPILKHLGEVEQDIKNLRDLGYGALVDGIKDIMNQSVDWIATRSERHLEKARKRAEDLCESLTRYPTQSLPTNLALTVSSHPILPAKAT